MTDGRVAGGDPDELPADGTLVEVLSAIPDAVYVFDDEDRFLWWNDAIPAVTGYADAEVAEMDPLDFVPPADRDRIGALIEEVAETGRVGTAESFIVRKNGERIPTEFKMNRVGCDADGRDVVVGIGRDVTDRRERRRELELYESAVEAASDAIYALDTDFRFRMVNDRFVERIGIPRENLLGEHISVVAEAGVVDDWVIDEAEAAIERLVDDDRDSVRLEASAEVEDREWVVENNFSPVATDDEPLGVVNVVRDVTERTEYERELERRRDELAALADINALVQATVGALVGAATREEVEETVCERLAGSGFYRCAWTAERPAAGGGLAVRARAGETGFVDALAAMDDETVENDLLDVVSGGEPLVIDRIDAESSLREPVRTAAVEHGCRSGVAVPLSYGDTVYGALAVNAGTPEAFSEREVAALETLGRVMGLAVNAARHRRLLFADSAVRLDFRTADRGSFFIGASAELGCEFVLEGLVPTAGGRVLMYVSLSGASPDRVVARARDAGDVDDCRVVHDDGDGGLLEVVSSASMLTRLVESGATVNGGRVADGQARVVAEVPSGDQVREVVAVVSESFPDVELVGRRDVERSGRSVPEFRASLSDRLTDRQRSALKAAYLSGYYDWPRGSTAEEVAEAMEVASPTLHQHLRAAEGKLLDAFFGDADT